MECLFEEILRKKTENTESEVLFNHWSVIKKNVPKALNVICELFPHYSLHEESHSLSILNNVYKILGKEVSESLNAIDIWLLLNVAYLHDFGMVVYADEMSDLLRTSDFISFINEKKIDPEFGTFAQMFDVVDSHLEFSNALVTVEKIEALKFLLAEYIRKAHSSRSKTKVLTDLSSYELFGIPLRIVKTIAQICDSHAWAFEKVMKLHRIEDGVWNEDCHPLFISCLLRLGDVLDLDNNRISPFLSKTIKTIPSESLFHRTKHFCIDHKQVNDSVVEFSATCDDYKTAELASSWFSLIDDEFQNQVKKWNLIKPAELKCSLPLVGDLTIDLNGWESIDGKKQPAFFIKPQKAMEYLQGAGIYRDKYQCMRELLQNAVDATYLRLWNEKKDVKMKDFSACLKSFPISVSLIKLKETTDPDYDTFHVEIRDYGIGMSKEDVRFLQQIGGSSDNSVRKKMIDSMPEWMKPSGTFGIGFQSVFLLVDNVKIESRRINSEKKLVVDAFSSMPPKRGEIYCKVENEIEFDIGTKLSFDYKAKKIPDKWSYCSNESFAERAIRNYDFVENESLDFEYGKLLSEIYAFAKTSNVPINITSEFGLEKFGVDNSDSIEWDFCSENRNMALKLYHNGIGLSAFYRGQLVERHCFRIPFIGAKVNILRDNASDVLTLSRNRIKNEYKALLLDDFLKLLIEYVDSRCFKNEELLPRISAFLLCYGKYESEIPERCKGQWKKIEFYEKKSDKGVSVDNLLGSASSCRICESHDVRSEWVETEGEVVKVFAHQGSDMRKFFIQASKHYFQYAEYVDGNFEFKKESTGDIIKESSWENWFENVYLGCWHKRNIIPCNAKYKKLALKDSVQFPYAYDKTFGEIGHDDTFSYKKMICPFVVSEDLSQADHTKKINVALSQRLIDITYENRLDEATTKDEIQQTYQQFVEDMKRLCEKLIS